VRVAKPEDAPAVESVLRASYPELLARAYPAELLAVVLPIMTRANPVLLASGTYYLAEDAGGAPVGCGGWTFERPGTQTPSTDRTLAHIRHFATRADWARRGVGRALLERCEQDARARGVRRFDCLSSLAAERFYAAYGFTAVEPVTTRFGPGAQFPSTRMVYDLPLEGPG
jgi:GNAT superfamily N-acetyltransferase